jgi:hypothetical protein
VYDEPEPITYSLPYASLEGAQNAVIACSLCGLLALDWERHVEWHGATEDRLEHLHSHPGSNIHQVE